MNEEEFENLELRVAELEKVVFSKNLSVKNFSKKTILDLISELKVEGFFDQPRLTKDIIKKLAERGFHYPFESLTAPLQNSIRKGILGRVKVNKLWAYVKR